jgi:hypothetical protein
MGKTEREISLPHCHRALFGEDKGKYRAWLKPLVQQLKNQSTLKVIRPLEEALAQRPGGGPENPLAGVPWKPPVGKPNAGSNDRDSFGASEGTRRG